MGGYQVLYSLTEREKLSLASTRKKIITLKSPDGKLYKTIKGIRQFCKEHNLNNSNISRMISGHINVQQHKGWRSVNPKAKTQFPHSF